LSELQLPVQTGTGVKWQVKPKPGSNICHKKAYGDVAFTFVREYRQFSLSLSKSPPPPLKPAFLSRLRETSDYSPQDFFGLKQWEDFFLTFGTHVVEEGNGGGRLLITVLETQLKNYFGTEDLFRKEKEIETLFSNLIDGESEPRAGVKGNPVETLIISSIRLFGGAAEFGGNRDLTHCENYVEMRRVIKEWVGSLPLSPVMLDSETRLISIPNLLQDRGMSKEAEIVDEAAKKVFGRTFLTPGTRKRESKSSRWTLW
jgi:hypothetical protein